MFGVVSGDDGCLTVRTKRDERLSHVDGAVKVWTTREKEKEMMSFWFVVMFLRVGGCG